MSVRVHILHPSGVAIWLECVSLDAADVMIKHMLASGYRPVPVAGGGGSAEWPKGPDGRSPLCPRHGAIMTERQKQSDTWWSHKLMHPRTGEDVYCRGYRYGPAEKDGYLVTE
jgi:hypothetical protein